MTEASQEVRRVEREECRVEVPFSLKYADNIRKLPYRSRKLDRKQVLHWGQRKLLMQEVYLLTKYGNLSKTVVYAGAADGYHVPFLSKLFPEHHFILYDPSKFHPTLVKVAAMPGSKITLHNEFFTDITAKSHAPKTNHDKNKVIFISDIRTVPEGFKEKQLRTNKRSGIYQQIKLDKDFLNEVEEDVQKNMEAQMNWHLLINPAISMLKFRLPYHPGTTTYLDGEIVMQVWAPPSTTESRLITTSTTKVE